MGNLELIIGEAVAKVVDCPVYISGSNTVELPSVTVGSSTGIAVFDPMTGRLLKIDWDES